MRIFCWMFVVSLANVGNYVLAQPVATDFSLPVRPESNYYDANHFLSVYQGKYHMGEDWNGNEGKSTDYGDPVYPMAVGKVVKALDQKGSIGKVVVVKHLLPDGQVVYSYYFHLSKILVSVNQIVFPDKPLGQIGDANGYYKGSAHLHFELRRVNQTLSSSYAPILLIATARKYLDPSLFIDDRKNQMDISTTGTTSISSEDFIISNYAPASLAYVTKGNQTRSISSAITAGWLDSTAYVWTDGALWSESIALTDMVFGPGINFEITFLQSCTLTIVVPGHNFQASRARDDMIYTASRTGLKRVSLETLSGFDDPISVDYDLRYLCFDYGAGTAVACAVHATDKGNPLYRWVIWYDPLGEESIGDWIEFDPNDIN